jgi:23S rRNA-/tRNA-specific pseudouridylate synthase
MAPRGGAGDEREPDAAPDADAGPPFEREYVLVNGLRHVAPYVHDFLIRVGASREGGSLLEALDAHVKFQGCKDASGRQFWQAELADGRVRTCADVLRRLPTGGPIPERWWRTPQSLDERIQKDTRLLITRHVHEPPVRSTIPCVLFENETLVAVDKPAGVPTLAGIGPGLSGENCCVAILNRARKTAASRRRLENDPTVRQSSEDDTRLDTEPLFAVNRVDQPVSGVWLLAKGSKASAKARAALVRPGAEKRKTYLALLRGRVRDEGFVVTRRLRVGEDGRAEVEVTTEKSCSGHEPSRALVDDEDGTTKTEDCGFKPAETRVVPVAYVPRREEARASFNGLEKKKSESTEDVDTLAVASLTLAGRFHQIRAHCAFAGHPVAGDAAYDDAVPGSMPRWGGVDPRVDDEEGTLENMRLARSVAWCAECRRPFRKPRDASRDETDETDDGSRLKEKVAGAYICLHALEYAFEHKSQAYAVSTHNLPPFADEALRDAGWPKEKRTPEAVLNAFREKSEGFNRRRDR